MGNFLELFMWLLWVWVAAHRLSLVAVSKGCSWAVVVAVRGLLTAVVSLWSTGSRARGLSSCGTWALLLRGTRDLPGPGVKPVSPVWQADS